MPSNPIRKYISPELIEENRYIYESKVNPDFAEELVRQVISILSDSYFRTEFIGFDDASDERVRPDVPLIFTSNHSGMAFPWDAILFMGNMYRRNNYEFSKVPRALVAPLLSKTRLMNPFLINDFWYKCGGVDATFINFETMMHNPDNPVLIYPEGVPGIGKGFNRKYQLQRFATSFVRMAIKYRTDIVPVYTINGEYINPHSYSIDGVNNIFRKIGIPFLPIGIHTPLLLVLPWMFYYALPAKIYFVRDEHIRPYEMTDKSYDALTDTDVEAIRDRIYHKMQAGLDRAVSQYGKHPFHWSSFFKAMKKNLRHFPLNLPFGWVLIFTEFSRQWNKHGKDAKIYTGWGASFLMMLKNPITLAYFVPLFGWLPLLLKGYKGSRLKNR